MNVSMIKVVSSMFKDTNFFSLIFVVTEIYRLKIVYFLPIFEIAITWLGALKLRAYSLYLHPSCVPISAFHVQQIYSYKRINKFSRQKWEFFLKFRVLKSRSRDLGSSKLAYMMLLIIVMLYPKFNFLCLTIFLVISKSINFAAYLSKWPSKNKGSTRARAKSQ